LTSETYDFIFGHLVGLLGRDISPLQGYYTHRKAQRRKTRTHIHASSRIRTNDTSVLDRIETQFVFVLILRAEDYTTSRQTFGGGGHGAIRSDCGGLGASREKLYT